MKQLLIDDWKRAHRFLSVRLAALLAALYALIPLAADQWPQVMPSFVSWFPQHGQQWAPVIGALLVIAARLLNQRPKQ